MIRHIWDWKKLQKLNIVNIQSTTGFGTLLNDAKVNEKIMQGFSCDNSSQPDRQTSFNRLNIVI